MILRDAPRRQFTEKSRGVENIADSIVCCMQSATKKTRRRVAFVYIIDLANLTFSKAASSILDRNYPMSKARNPFHVFFINCNPEPSPFSTSPSTKP